MSKLLRKILRKFIPQAYESNSLSENYDTIWRLKTRSFALFNGEEYNLEGGRQFGKKLDYVFKTQYLLKLDHKANVDAANVSSITANL